MAPVAGQGGSSSSPTLYVGNITSFDDLSDAFQRARGQVVNAASTVRQQAPNAADPFGHASADTAYGQVLRETLTALDHLGDGLLTLARRVEEAGAALVTAEHGIAQAVTP